MRVAEQMAKHSLNIVSLERRWNVSPIDTNVFCVRRFFNNVRLQVLKISFINVNSIVLSDDMFDWLKIQSVFTSVKQNNHETLFVEFYLSERENRSSVAIFFFSFLSKTRRLIRFKRIDITRPTTFNMIDSSMFGLEANCIHLLISTKSHQLNFSLNIDSNSPNVQKIHGHSGYRFQLDFWRYIRTIVLGQVECHRLFQLVDRWSKLDDRILNASSYKRTECPWWIVNCKNETAQTTKSTNICHHFLFYMVIISATASISLPNPKQTRCRLACWKNTFNNRTEQRERKKDRHWKLFSFLESRFHWLIIFE